MLAAEGLQADGGVALGGEEAALGGALEVAFLDEEGLVDFLERLGLLADGDGDRAHADGLAAVILGHHAQHAFVHFVESGGIDLQQLKRGSGDGLGDLAGGALLREVADEVDEIVGDAGRAAGAGGDLLRATVIDRDLEQGAAAADDALERRMVVVVESRLQREARAERRGEQAAAGGGADEREARDREADAAGVGALVDHDVQPEVLHRGVEVLLDGLRDAVDFVDEQDVALLEAGEQAGEVAGFLDDGAGGHADAFPQLVAEDEGEGGLAETGRAGEEDVV